LILGAKIYSLLNLNSMNKYLSTITWLKDQKFKVWIDGIEWNDKWSIGSKKPTIIKAIPDEERTEYENLNVTDNINLNVQSLMFRYNNRFLYLTCPRNITIVERL
jgi:hypothetical protein